MRADSAGHLDPFVGRIAAFIDRQKLLKPGARVLAAVSGGADSVAMLYALVALAARPNRRYALHVAHLDHGLRADSASDAAFVDELAQTCGAKATIERIEVRPNDGRSVETAAREVRYTFLARAARDAGCGYVATAHQADDNVETVLHRILRGTGVKGLRGVPPTRRLAGVSDIQLIRPMLDATAEQARAYLERLGAAWRTDHTNRDTRHTRNRIRHELLPLLRTYNGRVDEAILRLATAATWAGDLLESVGAALLAEATIAEGPGTLTLNRRILAQAGTPRASQALLAALARLKTPMGPIGMAHIQGLLALLDDNGPAGAHLPGGLMARRRGDTLLLGQLGPTSTEVDDEAEYPVAWPGVTALPAATSLEVMVNAGGPTDLTAFLADKPTSCEMFDADTVVGPVTARRWRAGDRFEPLGGAGRKKLSDFFGAEHVDAEARRAAWILCDNQGVIWAAPYRIAHRVRVTAATRRIAKARLDRRPF